MLHPVPRPLPRLRQLVLRARLAFEVRVSSPSALGAMYAQIDENLAER